MSKGSKLENFIKGFEKASRDRKLSKLLYRLQRGLGDTVMKGFSKRSIHKTKIGRTLK